MVQSIRRASLKEADAQLFAGRYRILAALGKGGSAQVFRVLDTSTGSELALKQLSRTASPKLNALFELEYQTLASLQHPRVVRVYEYGRESSGAFYTMELLDGEDLKDCAPLSYRQACLYLSDAAQALGLLHARRLLHRDVSPRNLWRTRDDRVKLIDFGALAPFGPVDHVMGTPPLVPPEALRGAPLDQRSDLYALGAVAYYLLSGTHAFPARDLRDLPELWGLPPPPPSAHVTALGRSDLAPIPAELDALVLSLLSEDARARPNSTAEVIDRLQALVGARRISQADAADAQLSNSAFVGRVRERRRLRRLLLLASRGRGQSAIIESSAGEGRSRLLAECALAVRVTAATVLHVEADNCQDDHGVANALALKLLDALPSDARRAAEPHAPWLAHLSPRVRERLGVPAAEDASGELRVRVQSALRDWLLALAEQHTLAILVDGLELTDEASTAVLLGIARASERSRLLLVCTSLRDRRRTLKAGERALHKRSRKLPLTPLGPDETLELLHSVFGSAEHLARLARRLHSHADGNPGHVLELSRQLVRGKVIGFVDGSWLLPQEIPEKLLARNREQALAARLDDLDAPARELGRVFSLHVGPLSLALASTLAKSAGCALATELPKLLEAQVLQAGDGGYRFAHEHLRLLLRTELAPETRVAAQRALAAHLLAQPDLGTLESLRAGLHLLEAGDPRGGDRVAAEALRLVVHEADKVGPALPSVEAALTLLRAAERPGFELVSLLTVLCTGGYYADRRYAARYGELAVSTLARLLGLDRARKLRPYLGRKLSLIVALLVAGIGFRRMRKNPRVPSFKEAMLLLFNCIATAAGTSIICIDPKSAKRYAEVLEPLTALGKRHIATFMHTYCLTLADTVRDAYALVYPRWQRLIARLESDEEITGLPARLRTRYLGGALYARGVIESQRDDARALATAEQLDALGVQLYQLSAHQVRTMYYANQGNLERYEHHRAEAEQRAIQQGTIWQVETWSPSASMTICLRTHDAMGMKHASEQLVRLSAEVPSLDSYAQRSRGAYLMLRKKHVEALPWLEGCLRDEPRQSVGWGRSHGMLARVYNRLAQHERARAACLRVVSEFDENDFAFPALNLIVQTELLIAEAHLGRGQEARAELASLLAAHGPNQGPLTLGALHEAGVAIALAERDEVSALRHLAELETWYVRTGVSSLAQRCQLLAARVHGPRGITRTQLIGGDLSLMTSGSSVESSELSLSVDRMLAGGGMSLEERAEKALQIIAENTRCPDGFLFLLAEDGAPYLAASLKDEHPSAVLTRWLSERIASEREDEQTQMLENDEEATDRNVLEHEGRHYRALPLFASTSSRDDLIGAAVLVRLESAPAACSAQVLASVSYQLQRAISARRARDAHSG